uniref:Uncharacterized protein n=1 Tax=Oryza meridionalis TaxID=40149 RepID=A0A0E0D206_9ORYZ
MATTEEKIASARLMRQQAQVEFGRARSLRLHAVLKWSSAVSEHSATPPSACCRRRRWISLMLVCSVCMPFACGWERKQSSFIVATPTTARVTTERRQGTPESEMATWSTHWSAPIVSLTPTTLDSLEETDAEEKKQLIH